MFGSCFSWQINVFPTLPAMMENINYALVKDSKSRKKLTGWRGNGREGDKSPAPSQDCPNLLSITDLVDLYTALNQSLTCSTPLCSK